MKNFARTIPEEFKQRDRFRATPEEHFTAHQDQRSDQIRQEAAQWSQERAGHDAGRFRHAGRFSHAGGGCHGRSDKLPPL